MAVDQIASNPTGAKSARMEQRTTQQVKDLIERAAALLGINASEFIVAAAAKAAHETVRHTEVTVLTENEHAAFFQALNATEPTAKLVELMKMHSEVLASR
jgi:uncharacterized protein (DUF1778 family)